MVDALDPELGGRRQMEHMQGEGHALTHADGRADQGEPGEQHLAPFLAQGETDGIDVELIRHLDHDVAQEHADQQVDDGGNQQERDDELGNVADEAGHRSCHPEAVGRDPHPPFGHPPPYDAGLSGERFTMTRVHARSQQDEPATFWLSRLRKDRACVTAIALLAVFSSRSRGVGLTRLWIVTPAMPTTSRSAAGTMWWRWSMPSLAGSRVCPPWRRRGTPTPIPPTLPRPPPWLAH